MRTGDSHVYLHSMRMFDTDFYSPYASCKSALGANSAAYYMLPVQLLYGLLGGLASVLGMDHFLALGLFNGLSGFVYLLAAYVLLRTLAPRQANVAFAIFALGGGPGGILYLVSMAFGWHEAAAFDTHFGRIAAYELMEGVHLFPILHMPRLYYTLSLALAFAAFALIASAQKACVRRVALVCFLVFLAQLVNMRVGTFAWGMMMVYVVCQTHQPFRQRTTWVLATFVPIALGIAATFWIVQGHPTYAANQSLSIRETMLFSSLLSAGLIHWILAPGQIMRGVNALPRHFNIVAWAFIGYLMTWTALYAGYQVYFGTYVLWIDVTSAMIISDWALPGLVAGGLWGLSRPSRTGPCDTPPWLSLWVLLILAVGVSAWGQGMFSQLLPRRLLVVMGLPLSILTAQAIARIMDRRPALGRGVLRAIVAAGLCSIMVATLFFQGPLGRKPGGGPFPHRHYEMMSTADATLLDDLGQGRVLAPLYNPFSFTEIIALRPENSVACGVGTFNHSDQLFAPLKNRVNTFFSLDSDDDARSAFLDEWCVNFVYCPDTCPVDAAVVEELRGMTRLREVASQGQGSVFEVIKP
jgi:hypothetical protein